MSWYITVTEASKSAVTAELRNKANSYPNIPAPVLEAAIALVEALPEAVDCNVEVRFLGELAIAVQDKPGGEIGVIARTVPR